MKLMANCSKCGKYAKLSEMGGLCRICKKKERDGVEEPKKKGGILGGIW